MSQSHTPRVSRSHPPFLAHARRVGILLASGIACAAVPAVASAADNLGTASPFAVLGATTVTNTGPSVLSGDLGVSPGNAITGFPPGILVPPGTLHAGDAVAAQAQSDLTTAYNVDAGLASNANLTGQDLGGLTLVPGVYTFNNAAQLTGNLTLNAQGNPDAQFVFQIGSTLTTASASSVQLINGASPCNVSWQVGSSATLGTGTAFEGTILAHTSVTADTGATVQGRLLANTGAVTLDTNTIDRSMCAPPTTPPPGTTGGTGGTGGTGTTGGTGAGGTGTTGGKTGGKTPPPSRSTIPTRKGSAILRRAKTKSPVACNAGFTATVRGREIKRVVFTLDGKRLANLSRSPFRVHVPAAFAASGHIKARVTFKDATRAKMLNLRYRACAAAVVRPLPAPSTFTG